MCMLSGSNEGMPQGIYGSRAGRPERGRGRRVVELMATIPPTELTLTLAPQRRFEAIDVNSRISQVKEVTSHFSVTLERR